MKMNMFYMLFISIVISIPQAHAMGWFSSKKEAINKSQAEFNLIQIMKIVFDEKNPMKNPHDHYFSNWKGETIFNTIESVVDNPNKTAISKHLYDEFIKIFSYIAQKKGVSFEKPKAVFEKIDKRSIYSEIPDLGTNAFEKSDLFKQYQNDISTYSKKKKNELFNNAKPELSEDATLVAEESISKHEPATLKETSEQEVQKTPALPADEKIANQDQPSPINQGTASGYESDRSESEEEGEDDLFLVEQLKKLKPSKKTQEITPSFFQKIMSHKLAILTGSTAVGALVYIIYSKYQERKQTPPAVAKPAPAVEQDEQAKEKLNQIKQLLVSE